MALRFLQYKDSKVAKATKEVLLGIDNPGAIITIKQVMVVQPENKTFREDERAKITELLTKDFK